MKKLFSPENAHWYRPNGEAMHTVVSSKGELRPATLRDARKHGLLPSVTNVLGVVAKPELIDWKLEQAVVAALTLPRKEGEAEDDFARRVVEDAQGRSRTAMEFGSALHAGAERVARGLEVDPADPCAAWLEFYQEWFKAKCARLVWAERVLVNAALGYAGTADLLMEHEEHGLTLVDLKTQSVKEGCGPTTYRSWGYQLAAYRQALGQEVVCMNLIMNSKEPHAPIEGVWTEEQMDRNWQGFDAARELWMIEKNYDPREKQKAEIGKAEMGSAPLPVA